MKTEETKQPAHTQGEWKVDNGRNIIIYNHFNRRAGQSRNEMAVIPELLIGGTYHISREEAEANAKLIVKCVNLFPKLLEELKQRRNSDYDKHYNAAYQYYSGNERLATQSALNQVQKIDELIKQAEQE